MDSMMNWWIWLCVGMGLFCLELFIPSGFYLLVIGLAFMIVGGLTWLGMLSTLNMQLAATGIFLVILIPTIRRPLAKVLSSVTKPSGSEITSQRVLVQENILPGKEGKGELTGAVWTVRNESTEQLVSSNEYRVDHVEGLTLVVKNGSKV